MKKIKVIIVEPNKKPRVEEIDTSLESMQAIVNGLILPYYPFSNEEICIICNEEGEPKNFPPNRHILKNEKIELFYKDMKEIFRYIEATSAKHRDGYITFTEDSFEKPYKENERTYIISSDNKAFKPDMAGYSIFGTSLDGKDENIRLDQYMADEKGGPDGWKIEKCYMNKVVKATVLLGTFFICLAPPTSENFESLPDEIIEKLLKDFEEDYVLCE